MWIPWTLRIFGSRLSGIILGVLVHNEDATTFCTYPSPMDPPPDLLGALQAAYEYAGYDDPSPPGILCAMVAGLPSWTAAVGCADAPTPVPPTVYVVGIEASRTRGVGPEGVASAVTDTLFFVTMMAFLALALGVCWHSPARAGDGAHAVHHHAVVQAYPADAPARGKADVEVGVAAS